MTEPNTLLEAVLDESGMSRAGLALRVNDAGTASGLRLRYDHTAVGRWIAGQRPRARVPELICAVLTAALGRPLTLEDIGMGRTDTKAPGAVPLAQFVQRVPALWRSDRLAREDVREASVIDGLPAIAPVWEWENPPEDRDVSRVGSPRVGQADVDVLRFARDRYEQIYRHAGGVAVRDRVVSFLDIHGGPILRGSYADAIGRQVHRAVGGLAAVAGICAYDSDYQGLAQRYFHQALRLAKASGDHAFGGYVLALLVNQALFLRDYRQAVALAEAALRTAGSFVTPALASDLHGMQAKAFGRMHDQTAAHEHMRAAEAATGRIGLSEEPPETGYVQPGLAETQFAEALLSLGDLSAATAHAEQAANVVVHARGRVNRLVTVTRVAIAGRELDHAAQAANTMLDQAQGMESRRLHGRFRAIRNNLAPFASSLAVRDVVERVDAALAVPM